MTSQIIATDLFIIDKDKSDFNVHRLNSEKSNKIETTKSSELSIEDYIKLNRKQDNPAENNQTIKLIDIDDKLNSHEQINPLKRVQSELENLVFGDEHELYQKIKTKNNNNLENNEGVFDRDENIKRSVWKDSDDQNKVKLVS